MMWMTRDDQKKRRREEEASAARWLAHFGTRALAFPVGFPSNSAIVRQRSLQLFSNLYSVAVADYSERAMGIAHKCWR